MSTTRTLTDRGTPTPQHGSGTVLVAVDDRRDWDALDWAAAEAGARQACLQVVHAWWAPWAVDAFGATIGLQLAAGGAGSRVLDEAAERVRSLAPSVAVSTRLLTGRPAAAIARAGRHADLVVLGQRDPKTTHPAASSLVTRVAKRVRGPVAVVSLSAAGAQGDEARRVVLAYDGSRDATPAVAFAFRAARSRGLDLTLLSTAGPFDDDGPLGDWRRAYPSVHVREVPVTGPLGLRLVAESTAAALVVVATRAHHRWPVGHLRDADAEADLVAVLDSTKSPVVLVPLG